MSSLSGVEMASVAVAGVVAVALAVQVLVAVEVIWRPRCLYVQDCTFPARLPCQWVIQDV
jgi:hypothetical protein